MNRMMQGLKNIVDTVTGNKATVIPPATPAPENQLPDSKVDVIQNMANVCEATLIHLRDTPHTDARQCPDITKALESIARFRKEFPK